MLPLAGFRKGIKPLSNYCSRIVALPLASNMFSVNPEWFDQTCYIFPRQDLMPKTWLGYMPTIAGKLD